MGGERGLCRRKSWQAGRVGQSYLWEGACSSFLASTTAWSLLGGTFPRRAWRDELAGGEQGLVPVSSPDRIIGGAAAALDVAGLMLSEPRCNAERVHNCWFSSNCPAVLRRLLVRGVGPI